ncbi:MAG: hypothetical protein QNK11_02720 [Legionella sp.]|nr:hypothetical protein [Legionella sp.]
MRDFLKEYSRDLHGALSVVTIITITVASGGIAPITLGCTGGVAIVLEMGLTLCEPAIDYAEPEYLRVGACVLQTSVRSAMFFVNYKTIIKEI